ncbi:MAG: hypothetical protein AMXMBFR66_31480 [Pseudomonadota bacterium]
MRIRTAPYTPPMQPRAHDREAVCRVTAELASPIRALPFASRKSAELHGGDIELPIERPRPASERLRFPAQAAGSEAADLHVSDARRFAETMARECAARWRPGVDLVLRIDAFAARRMRRPVAAMVALPAQFPRRDGGIARAAR